MTKNIFTFIVCGFLVINSHAHAATIFSKSYTGLELVNLSEVSTPSGYTADGSSVNLSSNVGYAPVIQWDFLGAATRSGVTIHVAIDYTATGLVDNDPRFMISDSTSAQGISRVDNSTGSLYITTSSIPTNSGSFSGDASLASNLGYATSGLALSFDLQFSDAATSTTLTGYSEPGYTLPGSVPLTPNFIDPTQALSFLMVSGQTDESYKLNSVSITVTANPVPEPASLTLGILGLIGFLLARRRR